MSLFIYEVLIRLFMTFILSLLLTPLVKLLAFRIGAYDAPGERRINTKICLQQEDLQSTLLLLVHVY